MRLNLSELFLALRLPVCPKKFGNEHVYLIRQYPAGPIHLEQTLQIYFFQQPNYQDFKHQNAQKDANINNGRHINRVVHAVNIPH